MLQLQRQINMRFLKIIFIVLLSTTLGYFCSLIFKGNGILLKAIAAGVGAGIGAWVAIQLLKHRI